MTTLPRLVAVSVVIPDVPPMFRVALAPCVTPPVPDKAVLAVIVPLLVRTTPVPVTVRSVPTVNVPVLLYAEAAENVAVGIEMRFEPPMVFGARVKLCVPELAVYVPLFVKLPA